MNKITKILTVMGACPFAIDWARKGKFASRQKAWDACEKPAWLFWYLGESEAPVGRLVLAACACARLALPYAKGPEAHNAIRAAEAWATGKGSLEAVLIAAHVASGVQDAYAAASAAFAAGSLTSEYAASVATDAAYAFTDAAEAIALAAYANDADGDAYADAYDDARIACCVAIRKFFPKV